MLRQKLRRPFTDIAYTQSEQQMGKPPSLSGFNGVYKVLGLQISHTLKGA